MTGYEIKQKLLDADSKERCFIKWWRKENDFADYELLEHFLQGVAPEQKFEGYELLSMEQMWHELKNLDPDNIWMEQQKGEPVLHWQHFGSDGQVREDVYRYSPEVLMAIFDQETQGDTLC